MDDIDLLSINTIRTLAIDAVQKANSGHPGTPMGMAPLAYTVWQDYLRYDPAQPLWPNRDRFILSPGHASMLIYSILHLTKVQAVDENDEVLNRPAVGMEDLKSFRQPGSVTPGHPEYRHTAGVEATTGPLGQGVSMSVGMAIAEKWLAAHYNQPDHTIIDYNIYTLCSDGDMMEGVASEAASLAAHLKLDNLCWIYDSNCVTLDGPSSWTFSENVGARFLAYGWNVLAVRDGNDIAEIRVALDSFLQERSRPTLIVVDTHIGYGSPNKQDSNASHGEPLGAEEVRLTKKAYGWPEEAQFLVPDGVYENFANRVGKRGAALRAKWSEDFRIYMSAFRGLGSQFQAMQHGIIPEAAAAAIPEFPADAKGLASRDSSGKVENALAQHYPWMLGGSADLDTSTRTRQIFEGSAAFSAKDRSGRNLHFGVREHAMGAIANGLALSKIRPYAATFLIFSDYLRPTMRLAALMGLPTIFIFTHDSISVGEDGPTHQPVEQIASLRAIPGFNTIRPGDANEVAEAWRVILGLKREPAALVLSRQPLPTIDRSRYASAAGVAKGAYVLADPQDGKKPEVILVSTGGELALAVGAYEALSREGIAARVVSMPSWNLFEKQGQAYQGSVLPADVPARVAVEQGVVMGWDRYVGRLGAVIGMHSFGASAPLKALATKFGFTLDKIIEIAKQQIASHAHPGATRDAIVGAPPQDNTMNTLKQLGRHGQSPWLDDLHRDLIRKGELARLIKEDGLKGMTSNPTIFEKAIGETDEYKDQLEELLGKRELDDMRVYEALAIEDIQDAADLFRPVYEASRGQDGFVSLEVSPRVANETHKTVEEATRLWSLVERENLMVKIPGTKAGVPAVERAIASGINVNITLLFSIEAYEAVVEAYMSGLEHLIEGGGDPSKLASVASFFLSRIDTAVDKYLDGLPGADEALVDKVTDKVAIASAKLAYARYKALFSTPRWRALAAKGAKPQRLLWASTSTKKKSLPNTYYIDALVGPDTVNTMPTATLNAFREHGKPDRKALESDVAGARETLDALDKLGIPLRAITAELLNDGVRKFSEAFDELLDGVATRRRQLAP